MLHASWPLSTLTVTKDRLDLNASLIGTYSFMPDQVISIEPYGGIPLIGRGIRINHTVLNYNESVIFFSFKDPKEIIEQIRGTGFLDQTSSTISNDVKNEVMERQKQGRFPIKVPVAVTIIVIWILLFFIDGINYLRNEQNPFPFGNGVLISIGFILILSTLTLFSSGFRKFVLKEGRDIKEVNRFLYFLILICGFTLMVLLFAQR